MTPLERVRARALEAAAEPPARPWRVDVFLAWSLTIGFSLAVGLVTGVLGAWSSGPLLVHASPVLLLLLAQLTGAYGAIAPAARRAQLASLVIAGAGMAVLVSSRGAGIESASPEWLCSLSHLGLVAGPCAALLLLQRRAHLTVLRTLSAGVAAGSIGALAGELVCGRGSLHVALFHLPVWIAAAAFTALLGRVLRSATYAP